MMSNKLPKFKAQPIDKVENFAANVLTNPGGKDSHLIEIIVYEDHHYRAYFSKAYFILPEDQPVPSKSQWNSLKKKLKRHDRQIFVFKDHGDTEWEGEAVYYIDFGYFAE